MTTTSLTVTTISDPTAFEALAPEWDDLVVAAPRPSPFLLHGWLSAWWQHAPGRQIRIEVGLSGERLVAAIPLELATHAGLTVARVMGHHHTALADVVAAADHREDAVPFALEALASTGADYVDIFGFADGSSLHRAADASGAFVVRRVEAPTLDLTEGWDAVYRAKTTSKKRNLHKRRRRQLSSLGDLTMTVARSEPELAAALEDAFVLHDLRWRGRPDGSGFATAAGRRFHHEAVRRLAVKDVARILLLRVDGRPIAFHYYFVLEQQMYVHRLAFDPAFARYSPGQIATLAAIEAAAEEGVRRVEFLGGGERYKMELADTQEPLYELVGFPTTRRGAAAAWLTRRSIETRLALKRSDRLHAIYFEGMRPVRRLRSRVLPTRGAG